MVTIPMAAAYGHLSTQLEKRLARDIPADHLSIHVPIVLR